MSKLNRFLSGKNIRKMYYESKESKLILVFNTVTGSPFEKPEDLTPVNATIAWSQNKWAKHIDGYYLFSKTAKEENNLKKEMRKLVDKSDQNAPNKLMGYTGIIFDLEKDEVEKVFDSYGKDHPYLEKVLKDLDSRKLRQWRIL